MINELVEINIEYARGNLERVQEIFKNVVDRVKGGDDDGKKMV